jgi:hypothetical protein
MKRILCFIIPLLTIISCDTNNKASNKGQKEMPKHSTKQDSNNSNVGLQLLEALSKAISTTQSITDSLKSANTPEKVFTLVNCNDTTVEFRDDIEKKTRYKVKIELTTFNNQDDSLNLEAKIKSFSITVNQIHVAISKNFVKDFGNIIPCNFEVFESKNKKNLLIFPNGFFGENSEKVIINLAQGRVTKINNTFILD